MILRSLRAEGFMRYQLLDLTDLPTGVIAVEGENESGKTSLGEAVAFALFGRTIRTEDSDPTQAIHWDVDVCRTTIEVEIPGQGLHRVERSVARTGEFEALLVGPQGKELAQGPRAVGRALTKLLGFDFPTFRYSFYVAQGELDLIQLDGRDNAKRIIYDMLGITTIERARTRLDEQLGELRERSDTLERDLIVAEVLHTEALPMRDELARVEGDLRVAQEERQTAVGESSQAAEAFETAEAALAAQRRRTAALTQLEGALVADAQRRHLLRARGQLTTLAAAVEGHVQHAEQAIAGGEQPLVKAREVLARTEAIDGHARRLEALVASRRAQLERETSADADDGLPQRQARALEASRRESTTFSTVAMIGCLLLALAAGGAAAGLHTGPGGAPALVVPNERLISPRLNITIENVTPQRASIALGSLAGVFLLLGVAFGLRRAKAHARGRDATSEHDRLAERLEAGRRELEACRGFSVPALNELSSALSGVRDPQIQETLRALQDSAGEALLGRATTPGELRAAAKQRHDDLETRYRQAEPRLTECRRVGDLASKALEKVEQSLAVAYPNGPPGEEAGGDPPAGDLSGLARQIERATAAAARARIELEALLASGQDGDVPVLTRELRDALTDSMRTALQGDELEARYKEQSGLPELLKQREDIPTSEALRAVIKRERELLDEIFGDEEDLRERHREAEERLRVARLRRGETQAELDAVTARGARTQAGRARLEELEAKIQRLRRVLDPTRREVKAREEAIKLLEELIAALKARFGPGIARYIELVLPRLTQGRYRRTRIDEDLDVRVYSRERGDYVRVIELSLGTADQLLVALRLGLSRALIASRGIRGGHFLFLDEPLVSADSGREQAFFDLLKTFDQEFAQIFVTSPRDLPSEGPFAARLSLRRDEHVVRLESARASA